MDRCPQAYFSSNNQVTGVAENEKIKVIYESMKKRVENVVEKGEVCTKFIANESQNLVFNKYRTPGFARSNHPAIIQVLIESAKEKDNKGQAMPNLVYVSRGKRKNIPTPFQGWCLNSLMMDPWFLLYAFLFLGAYGQDCYDFILFNSTYKRWWNDQRIWLIRGLSPYLFGLLEYIFKHLGIATIGFIVTNKVQDNEQSKRYDQGLMEFGVHSPIFVPLTTASTVKLFAFIIGIIQIVSMWNLKMVSTQLFIADFGVLNSWSVYEAIILRSDNGKMPIKTTVISFCLASVLCGGASLIS